jgi:hypothetical protein
MTNPHSSITPRKSSTGFVPRTAHALLAAVILCPLVGCVSAPLPPRLTAEQSKRLSELPLPYSIGVAPYMHPVYSDRLTVALKASGVFAKVEPLVSFRQPPDLIATVEKSVHGTAVIPALTFLTAGVVPTVVQEDHGFVFSLAPSAQRSRKTMVDASYSGTTTLGWAGLGVRALPGYTGTEPVQSGRFLKMLAYRTLAALKNKPLSEAAPSPAASSKP